ncbi:hypothetical protein BTO06_11855 [Tenacibaculum sp. SZ-18]|uniref:SMI1/KNR4 family protein n=1 Tax=Tenacibaculum sp. SZ-18 TaxID=754423 RepID=UPI000CA3431D|nr:SMI1/KNR4 family protein [Tenacibaculum sp. SZ-18]AUC15800.1 hypothetical protein BTO06_11855 [Tenacibaculum sp. SZ-18]
MIEIEIRNRLNKYEKLGIEKQSNGTELIGKAPHIAPLAYLHSIYKGLNNDEIGRLEQELKTEIPKDYKEFLKFSNGLHIFNTTLYLNGLRESYNRQKAIENRLPFALSTKNLFERPRNAKPEYFFIGGYDYGNGSLLYVNKNNNKVYRCGTKNVKPLNEWNSVNEMILTEIDRLIELHSANGELKENIKKTTPENNFEFDKQGLWNRLKNMF